MSDYLWDGSGDPEPATQELESLLARYRCSATMPDFRSVLQTARPPIDRRWLLPLAAAIVIAVVGGYIASHRRGARTLRSGEVVRTGDDAHLRIEAPSVGVIDVAENTTLSLVEERHNRYHLDLRVGTIHAVTTSPPGVFIVDTPKAQAIDLGCEYTLTVSHSGQGVLRVESGWVELARGSDESVVPAGAAADIGADGELTAPYFEDATPRFKASVRRFQLQGDDATLELILADARPRDALTLLNLFPRSRSAEQRLRIYDRLNGLVPAPASIPREAMLWWGVGTTEAWWSPVLRASGVPAMKKKKR